MSRNKRIIIGVMLDRGYPIETAKYAVAVSAFETADWTSEIYRKNHNLFGMKLPKVRKTTAKSENLGYATYVNAIESATDIVYYLRALDYPRHYNDLYGFVLQMKTKGYFEADFNHYYAGVQSKYRKYFKTTG